MKNESKSYIISYAIGALTINAVFAGNFLGAMYASDYLLPDRPGVALLAGLVAGVAAVAWVGRIARRDNERHEKEEI